MLTSNASGGGCVDQVQEFTLYGQLRESYKLFFRFRNDLSLMDKFKKITDNTKSAPFFGINLDLCPSA